MQNISASASLRDAECAVDEQDRLRTSISKGLYIPKSDKGFSIRFDEMFMLFDMLFVSALHTHSERKDGGYDVFEAHLFSSLYLLGRQ
jgi:hypothetical protein